MNIDDWLNRVRYLDELINAKIAERDQLRDLATKITPEMSGMPHGSGVSDKVGNIAVKIVDLTRETDELIDELVDHKQEVITALRKLNDLEYLVMHKHYIQGMTINAIAEDLDFCREYISKIKANAKEKLMQFTSVH